MKQRPHELGAPLPAQRRTSTGRRAAREVAGQPCLVEGAHVASLTRGLRKADRTSATRLDTV